MAVQTPAEVTGEELESRVAALLAEYPPDETPEEVFWGAQFDAGLTSVDFPVGHGGLGLSPDLNRVVQETLLAGGAPANVGRNFIGLGMAAPTIVAHGTEAQKRRWLRPLFTNEEIWCQLFSETGAGSDIADLATRAVRDGDEWVVDGQKVWTSFAHTARFGLLLARTDPGLPKHRGLTYFVVDMSAPGVDIRPLYQMTGDAEFNEVFLSGVRVPDSMRLGAVGEGWRVALTTLMNERVAIGGGVPPRGSGPIAEALALWSARPAGEAVRDELVKHWVAAEVARLTNVRAKQLGEAGTPGPEGSVGKLAFALVNQRIYEFCMRLMGPEAMCYPGYEMRRPERGNDNPDVRRMFLRSRAFSIEGGTSEIMRNILGERVLGLPPEPRVDRDVAWNDRRRRPS